MWSRRAQEYEAKIDSGDLVSIAEVVRDLHRAGGQPEQSYSERQLYEKALARMAREVAAVEKTDEPTAVKRVEGMLTKKAALETTRATLEPQRAPGGDHKAQRPSFASEKARWKHRLFHVQQLDLRRVPSAICGPSPCDASCTTPRTRILAAPPGPAGSPAWRKMRRSSARHHPQQPCAAIAAEIQHDACVASRTATRLMRPSHQLEGADIIAPVRRDCRRDAIGIVAHRCQAPGIAGQGFESIELVGAFAPVWRNRDPRQSLLQQRPSAATTGLGETLHPARRP